jgi:UDP:flavonoid glycosyltransferase YjiC (YdhE family)
MMEWWYVEVIDPRCLNSKVLMKTLWQLKEDSMGFGLSVSGYNWAMSNYKMAWREPSGHRMYDRMLPIDLLPSEDYVDASTSGKERLKKFILTVLRKEGGLLNIVNKERKWRPDAIGCVKKSCLGYQCFPCEPDAIVERCGMCGTLNLYSHADKGQDIRSEQWRCAACWADLAYTYVDNLQVAWPLLNFDKMVGIQGGSQLDDLLLINYGDVYDDLTLDARGNYVKKDISLIRKVFNNAYQTVVEIGTNISDNERVYMTAKFPRVKMVYKPRSNHGAKTVMYELHAMLVDAQPKTRFTTTKVYGLNRLPKPIISMEQSDLAEADIVVFKDVPMTMNQLMATFHKEVRLILPNLGSHLSGIGMKIELNSQTYYQLGATSDLGVMNTEAYMRLTTTDVLVLDNCKVVLELEVETENWLAIVVKRFNLSDKQDGWMTIKRNRKQTISLPMPDFYAPLSNTMVQTWSKQTTQYDEMLLNMLLIRNMTGKLEYGSLREFAVGYALRSYSAQGKVSKNLHILYEMVETHVLLAMAMSHTATTELALSKPLASIMNIPILKSSLPQLSEQLITLIVSSVRVMASQLIGVDVSTIGESFFLNKGTMVDGWIAMDDSLTTANFAPITELQELKVYRVRQGVKPHAGCSHHLNCACKPGTPRCACCNWAPKAKNSQYCVCCGKTVTFDFDDALTYIDVKSMVEERKRVKSTNNPRQNLPTAKPGKNQAPFVKLANAVSRDLRTNEEGDNKYVTAANFQLSAIYTEPRKFFELNTLSNDKPWVTTIRYNVKEVLSNKVDWFEIIAVDNSPTPEGTNCAKHAFEVATGWQVPSGVLEAENEDNEVSSASLMSLFKKNNMNAVLVHKDGTALCQCVESRDFFTIIHGSLIPGMPTNHFAAGKLLQTDLLHKYINTHWNAEITTINECIASLEDTEDIYEVSHNNMLIANGMLGEIIVDPKATYNSCIPIVYEVDGSWMFSNNPGMGSPNIYNGKVHTPIREELASMLELLAKDDSSSHRDTELHGNYDRLTLDIDNLEEDLNKEIKAEVKQWLTTINTISDNGRINRHSIRRDYKVKLTFNKFRIQSDKFYDKLKTLDVVIIATGIKFVKAIVVLNRLSNKIEYITNSVIQEGTYKVYVLKISFSSLLRKLTAAARPDLPFQRTTRLMHEMTLITGVGGSGKTEEFAQRFDNNWMAVAMTSAATETMKSRLLKYGKSHLRKNVMTVERALVTNTKTSETLVVDEAKQMSLLSLITLVGINTKAILLLGDTSQTGAVDLLHQVQGERITYNLTDAVLDKNITKLGYSRRLGNPLAAEIGKINPDFKGDPGKVTDFKIHHLTGIDEIVANQLRHLVVKLRIQLVLAPTHEIVNWVHDSMAGDRTVETSTVYGYQSKEQDRVAYVIKPNEQGKWGLARDKLTIETALTRAKEYMHIIVINSDVKETEAVQLISLMGSGNKYGISHFEQPIEIQQQIADASTSRYPGTSVQITKDGDNIIYKINTPFNLSDGEMIYNSGAIEVTHGNELVKHQLYSSIDTNEVIITNKADDIDSMRLDRMRALAWLVDKFIGKELGVPFYMNGNYYRLKKTKSCPYNSGLTLRYDNIRNKSVVWMISAAGALSYIGYRKLHVKAMDTVGLSLLSWLEVKTGGMTYSTDPGPFSNLIVPHNINSLMLAERLSRLPNCLLDCVMGSCKPKSACTSVKSKTKPKLQTIADVVGTQLHTKLEHVINHNLLLVSDKYMLGYALNYTIIENTTPVETLKLWWNIDEQIIVWNTLIEDVNNLNSGRICGELEGLTMSLAKHKEHNTAAYKEYRNKISKIKDYSLDAMDNTLWLSAGFDQLARLVIKDYTEYIYINTHNYRVQDKLTELLDGIMLLKDGSIEKGTVMCYAGFEPVLPALYNKHYCRILVPQNEVFKKEVSQYKMRDAIGQIDNFLKGIVEDVNLDVDKQAGAMLVNDVPADTAVILMGLAMGYCSTALIARLMINAEMLVGWIPTNEVDERVAQLVQLSQRQYLVSNFSGITAPLDEEMAVIVNGYDMNDVVLADGRRLHAKIMDYAFGFAYIEVTKTKLEIPICNVFRRITSGDNVTVRLPWLNCNMKTILRTKKLIDVKDLIIKPHLFRKLCMRMLIDNDVKIDDVLAYARTMGSAYETSEVNFRMKYNVRVDVLRNTAYAAWYYHSQLGKKFAVMVRIWGAIRTLPKIVQTNIASLIHEVLQVIEVVSSEANDIANLINDIIADQLIKVGLHVNLLGQCDNNLKLMFTADQSTLMIKPPAYNAVRIQQDDNDEPEIESEQAPIDHKQVWTAMVKLQTTRYDLKLDEDYVKIIVQDLISKFKHYGPDKFANATHGRMNIWKHMVSSQITKDWMQALQSAKNPGNEEQPQLNLPNIDKTLSDTKLATKPKKTVNFELDSQDISANFSTRKQFRIVAETLFNKMEVREIISELESLALAGHDLLLLASDVGKGRLGELDVTDNTTAVLQRYHMITSKTIVGKEQRPQPTAHKSPKALINWKMIAECASTYVSSPDLTQEERAIIEMSGHMQYGDLERNAFTTYSSALTHVRDLDTRDWELRPTQAWENLLSTLSEWDDGDGADDDDDNDGDGSDDGSDESSDSTGEFTDGDEDPSDSLPTVDADNQSHSEGSNNSDNDGSENTFATAQQGSEELESDNLEHTCNANDNIPAITQTKPALQDTHTNQNVAGNIAKPPMSSIEIINTEQTIPTITINNPITNITRSQPKKPGLFAMLLRQKISVMGLQVSTPNSNATLINTPSLLSDMQQYSENKGRGEIALKWRELFTVATTSANLYSKQLATLTTKPITPTLVKHQKQTVLLIAFGSTGEIVPLIKLGNVLLANGLYNVIICCANDEGAKIPTEMIWWQMPINILNLQQLVISMFKNLDAQIGILSSYLVNKAVLQSINYHSRVSTVISNVICYPATLIARHFKANLLFTTPALEVASTRESYKRFSASTFSLDERFFLKPMLAAAWFDATGEVLTNVPILQLDDRKQPVFGLFPHEWSELCKKPSKYNIKTLTAFELNIEPPPAKLITDTILILAGSTMGRSWLPIMQQALSLLANTQLTVAMSLRDMDSAWAEATNTTLRQRPKKWTVVKWIDYKSITNCTIITHGGAGVIANVTQNTNKIIIAPMIGDNHTNAEWLKPLAFVESLTNHTTLEQALKNIARKPYGKITYNKQTKENSAMHVLQWLKTSVTDFVRCDCGKPHTLLSFIGTRGDFNSIVPATEKLFGSTHVIAISHIDHMADMPSQWIKLPLHITSRQCAEVATKIMGSRNISVKQGINHYRDLVDDLLPLVRKIETTIDTVVTSFFSPLASALGTHFKCKTVYIDAMPNRLFYVDGAEILTGLPMHMTEAGNSVRHKAMEALDKSALGLTHLTTSPIEVVTCSKLMYEGLLNEALEPPYNLHVNNAVTALRIAELDLPSDRANILITFGSIKCSERIMSILKAMENNENYNTWYSGQGNQTALQHSSKYIELLNYPNDLGKFDVVVHHGGIGTTWNCAKAKVIQLIWPIFGDQFIWASMVKSRQLGVAVHNLDELMSSLNDAVRLPLNARLSLNQACEKLLENYTDDEEEILKLLGTERMRTWTINLPYNWDAPKVVDSTPVGEYISTAKLKEKLHNPGTTDFCTINCLTKVGKITSSLRTGLIQWKNPGFHQLKTQLILLNINFRLFIDDRIESMMVFQANEPIVNLNIIQAGPTRHATLWSVEVNTVEKLVTHKKPIALEELLIDRIKKLAQERSDEYAVSLENPKLFMEKQMYRMMNLNYNLDYRLERKEKPFKVIAPLQVRDHPNVWAILGTSNLQDNTLHLIANSSKTHTIIALSRVFSDRTILLLSQPVQLVFSTIVLIELEKAVELNLNIRPRSQINPTKYMFINQAAKRTNTVKKYRDSQVLGDHKTYRLIVNCTDNQKHDKFDPKVQIANAIEIILPERVKREEFDKIFMGDEPALLYNDLFVLLKPKPANRVQKHVLTLSKRGRSALQKGNKWFIKLGPAVQMHQSWIGDNYSQQMTWKELKELIGDAAALPMEVKYVLKDDTIFTEDNTRGATQAEIAQASANQTAILERDAILVAAPLRVYVQTVMGAGLSKGYSWLTTEDSKTTTQDWWALKHQSKVDLGKTAEANNVTAMQMHSKMTINIQNTNGPQGSGPGQKTQNITNPIKFGNPKHDIRTTRMPNFDAMVFWDDEELTDWANVYAPFESKIKSTEWAQRLVVTEKHSLTPYPENSRPVMTKVAFEELRSIAGRLFSVKKVRKAKPNKAYLLELIYQAFFHDKAKEMVSAFKAATLYYDAKDTVKWMEKHRMPGKVYDDLKETLQAGLYIQPLADINVHIKLESLLKTADKVIMRWEQQKARIIVWQRYAVAAIFSPIFTEAKKRLHKLFNNKVVYADGKTPEQLSSFMRGVNQKTEFVMSTDLEQQDRQTDDPIIDVEHMLYQDLGVHIDVLSAWRSVHEDWRFKGAFAKGFRRSMRLTGQATTAIGNAITTLQCNAEFVVKNNNIITFFMLLGDDNAVGLTEFYQVDKVKRNLRDNFNMIAKPTINRHFGDFCHFLIYRTCSGYWELGPDYVRLRNRYEVTNGIAEATPENMIARTMSYAMTVGNTPEIQTLINRDSMPIQPTMWYDMESAMRAMELMNEMSQQEVIDNYNELIAMMNERKIYTHVVKFMSSTPRKQ